MKAFLSSSLSKTGRLEGGSRAHFYFSRPRLWTRYTAIQQQALAAQTPRMENFRDYKDWSQERLIQKVIQLEKDLREKTSAYEAMLSLLSCSF
jgi:hypothetical protein